MEPNAPILKKTFLTVAVMLAAWVAFIGTVSTVAVLVTSRAVGGPEVEDKAASDHGGAQTSEKPATTTPAGQRPQQRI
jgi:hypothetical protein